MLRLPTKLLFGFDPVTLRPKSCDLKGPDLLLPIQLISPELLAVACLNIPPQLLRQPRPCFQLPRQHLYKTFIAFIALRLRRGEHGVRSEEHTSELQSLMRISYAVFCLKKKNIKNTPNITLSNQ